VRLGLSTDEFCDNFAPLRSVSWQVHVYGEPGEDVVKYCAERKFTLHAFAWRPAMEDAGFVHNAIYLVRPDGYIATASRTLPK
jgi:hypothetical protein